MGIVAYLAWKNIHEKDDFAGKMAFVVILVGLFVLKVYQSDIMRKLVIMCRRPKSFELTWPSPHESPTVYWKALLPFLHGKIPIATIMTHILGLLMIKKYFWSPQKFGFDLFVMNSENFPTIVWIIDAGIITCMSAMEIAYFIRIVPFAKISLESNRSRHD
jgi:hypothetical protein